MTEWAGRLGYLGGRSQVRVWPNLGSLAPGRGPYRHWQVSSRHHQTRTLDYGYLLGLLEDMQAHWEEAASLPQEQVGSPHGLKMLFLEAVLWGLLGLGQAVRGRVLMGYSPHRDSKGLKTDKLHDAGKSK